MRNGMAAVGITLLLFGCSNSLPPVPPVSAADTAGAISPRDAIVAAANAAPRAVPGTFTMLVRATGRNGRRVYLNSELDYRDQRNLTVNIEPGAAEALARRFGAPADQFFLGKIIHVRGAARRTRIDFLSDGRATGLYYYQTHVAVGDPDQIVVVDQRAR
jgi:hypothetical protein